MDSPAVPRDEPERLAALRGLKVLDTPPEERFDRITRIAAKAFGVPAAMLSLVDADRVWHKSRQGPGIPGEVARGLSFCSHAVLKSEILIVRDAAIDPRFAENPWVRNPPNVRFYAGCPIEGPGRLRVGVLCILDVQPHDMERGDYRMLEDLAALAGDELRRGS